MAKNKITFLEAEVLFEGVDGYKISVHPFHVYTVFGTDTVTFKLIALPKESGLCILTSKAQDLEVDGVTYTMEELPSVLQDKFAESGAQARAEIVDELPESGRTNTIYLVPRETPEGGTVYDEYIWLKDEQRWELIGDTSIEMYRYLKKDDFAIYSALTEDKIDFLSGAVDDLSDELDGLSGETMIISGNVDELLSDVATISGDVTTLSGETMTISGDLLSHVADMVKHITAEERAAWNEVSAKTDTSAFTAHTADTVVHITAQERTSWNEVSAKTDTSAFTAHTADTVVHITAEERIDWNAKADQTDLDELSGSIITQVDALEGVVTAHTANTDIHVTTADKTNWNGKADATDLQALSGEVATISGDVSDKADASALTEHTSDTTIHVTSSDKTNWNAKADVADLQALSGDVATVSGKVDENEQITAAALNDLDLRLLDLEDDSDDIWDAVNELANDLDDKADVSALTAYTTATEVNTLIDNAVSGKQDTLTAGEGIDITNNTISVTGGGGADLETLSGQVQDMDRVVAIALNELNMEVSGKADASALTEYTTASEVSNMISGKADSQDVNTLSGQVQTMDRVVAISLNEINNDLGGVKFVLISQSDYDNLPVKDSHTLYIINDVQ